jgi:hypothetical protein
MRSQITGNAGLFYTAWQLTRRGWHVMPTIRNARGSDLIVVNDDETVFLGVQSKAVSKRNAIGLGLSLDKLRSEWWVITVFASLDEPICFILSLDEVKQNAGRNKGGDQGYWLNPPQYDCDEYRNAWHRLGAPDVSHLSA